MPIETTTGPNEIQTNNNSATDNSASAKFMASAYNDNSFTQSDNTIANTESNTSIAMGLSQSIWGELQTEKSPNLTTENNKDSSSNPTTLDFSIPSDAGKLEPGLSKGSSDTVAKGEITDQKVEATLEKVGFKGNNSPLAKLGDIANDSIDRTDLGDRVPANARKFAGMKVPGHVKCASTVSDWLISAGEMNSRDFKIRVKDMNPYLAHKFGAPETLSGKFDLNDYPEGPVGFISATGHTRNGSNHIAFVEREGNNVFIIHNKNGKVVKEDIREKFYTSSGNPRYKNMKLFNLNEKEA